MAVSNLLWPGRKVLVLNLGTFSHRFAEMSLGVGAEVKEIFPRELSSFHVFEIKKEFEENKFDVLTIVHGETSCGMKNIHLEEITKLAHSYGVLTIVDGVTTISTMPFLMDEWKIDVTFTAGQKGISAIPGVSLIAFSERAFEVIQKRSAPMPHWCLDARRAYKFWVNHEYHYTAPVTGLLSMYEALRLICQETLEERFKRHQIHSELLQKSLEIMGFELYAPKEFRLNSVVAVKNLKDVSGKDLLKMMRTQHQVEISGAFGLDIFRIGQMGEQCRSQNVRRVLKALGESMHELGKNLDHESALDFFDSAICPVNTHRFVS
jgi:alanine-glyoxylate transaminase / serine-glyoxylate transaminase / serine-pyruvate transaminase